MSDSHHGNIFQQITRWASVPGMKGVLRKLAVALIGNTIIAILISLLSGNFWVNFILSQCIGLSIYAIATFGERLVANKSRFNKLWVYLAAIISGSPLGVLIAYLVLSAFFAQDGTPVKFGAWYVPVYLGLFFGAISSYIHYSRREVDLAREKLRAEETARIKQDKQLAEAQLKLIQAQIEPHFLFNTLANISSLIPSDPNTAQYMLEQLNQYLRTSLSRTRNGQMSLRHEIDLLNAYLSIIKIRMGKRLQYKIDVDEAALNAFIPALLLQPIVENAIKHGLEPKLEGGNIAIRCRLHNDTLIIEINDSGIGENANWKQGTGLANVRDRVNTFYQQRGKFSLTCNQNGSSVLFELPVQETPVE